MIRQDFGFGWYPSADALHAPPNCLLRADNLVWDDLGIVGLRPGSSLLYQLADLDVHSIYTAFLGGTRYRLAGAGNRVYANGADIGAEFQGSGDIAMFSWLGHAFMARGATRLKYNGSLTTNWGMKGPTAPPYVTSLGPFESVIATFNSTESPGFTAEEGTITATYPTGSDGTANGALELTPASTGTGRGTIVKEWTSDQDFLTVSGYPGDARDIFDFLVWITEPEKVETITVMVGLDPGDDPFQSDYYYFDFRLGGPRQSTITLPSASTVSTVVEQEAVEAPRPNRRPSGSGDVHGGPPPGDDPIRFEGDLSPPPRPPRSEEAQERIQERIELRSRERKEMAFNPGWTHLSVMRGQFNRVGATPGRGWNTVRGFKVVYKASTGAVGTVRFDTARFLGGAGTASLIGKFSFRMRWAKQTGNFVEKSPAGPPSDFIGLLNNAATFHVPRDVMAAKDPQADEIWVYMYGGVLGAWYRVHIAGVTAYPSEFGYRLTEFPGTPDNLMSPRDRVRMVLGDFALPNGPTLAPGLDGGYRIVEFPKAPDGALTSQDRRRLSTGDFAAPVLNPLADGGLTIKLRPNEATALNLDDQLELDFRSSPENIVAIGGPYQDRLLVLSQEANKRGLLMPSERRQPGQFRWSRAFAVGDDTETCYNVVVTTGGAYVLTSRDIYLLTGTGDDNPEDDSVDLKLERSNIGSPPVGPEVAVDGNSFAYRARDGWRQFDGAGSTLVPRAMVDLLYKGQTRHGVSAINLATGRFRAGISNGILTALTPEGASATDSAVLHRYDHSKQKWYRHTYPYSFRSLFREPDGTILVGDTTGKVLQLDSGTSDNGAKIPVVAWTPDDYDEKLFHRKDPLDFQLGFDSGGDTLTVGFHLDGGAEHSNVSTSAALRSIYKKDLTALPAFRSIQHRLTGSFNTFKLYGHSTSYRLRPMHRMAIDTGYIQTGKQDIDWVREIRLLVNSPANLSVKIYFDDTLLATETVTVVADKTQVVTIPCGREYRGGAPRILITTTSSPGTGEVGFELYWVEIRYEPTGNVTEKNIFRMSPEDLAR